jgi:hypothetical protein
VFLLHRVFYCYHYYYYYYYYYLDGKIDEKRETDRQIDRQAEKADRQTDRQTAKGHGTASNGTAPSTSSAMTHAEFVSASSGLGSRTFDWMLHKLTTPSAPSYS